MLKKKNILSVLVLLTSIFVFCTNAFGVGRVTIVPGGSMTGAGEPSAAGSGGGPSAPLKLEQCSVNNGSLNISVNPRITMRFTKNVADKVVRNNNAAAIKLVKKPSNEEVSSYKIAFSDEFEDRQFIQLQADNLKGETTYAVQVSRKIQAKNLNDFLSKEYEIIFTTSSANDSHQTSNSNQSSNNSKNTSTINSSSSNKPTTVSSNTGQITDSKTVAYKGDGSSENPYQIVAKQGTYTSPSKFWINMVQGGGFNVVFEGREGDIQSGELLYSYNFNKANSVTSHWTSDWKYAFRLAPYCNIDVSDNSVKVAFPWKGDFSFYWKDWEYKLNVTKLTENLPEEKRIKAGDKIKVMHYGNYDEKQTSRGTDYKVDLNKKSNAANWTKTIPVDDEGYAVFSGKNYIKYGGNYSIEKVSNEENLKQKQDENKKTTNNSEQNNVSYKFDKSLVLDKYKVLSCLLTGNNLADPDVAIKTVNLNRDMLFISCSIVA